MPKLHVKKRKQVRRVTCIFVFLFWLAALAGCRDDRADTFAFADGQGSEKEAALADDGGTNGYPDAQTGGQSGGGAEERTVAGQTANGTLADSALTGNVGQPDSAPAENVGQPDSAAETEAARIVVHICGAVVNPDVYELPEGSRVIDAVKAAGGFTAEASGDSCNLAAPVSDGCRVYIMTEEECSLAAQEPRQPGEVRYDAVEPAGNLAGDAAAGASAEASGKAADASGKINLNTADAAALMTLPGIGEAKAQAILAYREANGSFAKIEDVMKVSGIKQAAFEKIRDRITV